MQVRLLVFEHTFMHHTVANNTQMYHKAKIDSGNAYLSAVILKFKIILEHTQKYFHSVKVWTILHIDSQEIYISLVMWRKFYDNVISAA